MRTKQTCAHLHTQPVSIHIYIKSEASYASLRQQLHFDSKALHLIQF